MAEGKEDRREGAKVMSHTAFLRYSLLLRGTYSIS